MSKEDRALEERPTSALLERLGPIRTHARVIIPLAVIAVVVVLGTSRGVATAVLFLAAVALLTAIGLFWQSIRTLVGETPLAGADAYALGAPRQEEERKQAMLRALKDLEFERNVGKISEEDFHVLNRKYREEAKRLLRVLDEEAAPRRAKVERLLEARLREAGLREAARVEAAAELAAAEARADREDDPETTEPAKPTAGTITCAACGAKNDDDATFCKKCGKRCVEPSAGAAKSGAARAKKGRSRGPKRPAKGDA